MALIKREELEDEAYNQGINVQKANLPGTISGIYYNDETNQPLIAVNSSLKTQAEQTCVIAEELGHHYTSYGNLLTDGAIDKTVVQQQETRAKRWAVGRLISLKNVVKAYEAGSKNLYEIAEYLDVTVEFVTEAFGRYCSMYGKFKEYGRYIIYFDPPGILKKY